jgi:uncharacterized membrane protein
LFLVAADGTPGLNRIERVLAYMIAASAGLAFVAIVLVLVGGFAGWDMTGGIWPTVVVLPLIGLPFAFLLIIAFLVVSAARRRRPQNGAG